jgi:hypothetical protein
MCDHTGLSQLMSCRLWLRQLPLGWALTNQIFGVLYIMVVQRAWKHITRKVGGVAEMVYHLSVGYTIPGVISQKASSILQVQQR